MLFPGTDKLKQKDLLYLYFQRFQYIIVADSNDNSSQIEQFGFYHSSSGGRDTGSGQEGWNSCQ